MEELSVLSLNLRFGLADDGPNAWEHRKAHVLGFFQAQQPDLVATQEANHFQIDYLAENLPGYAYIGRRVPAPTFWQDNVLFYRRSLVCREQISFFLSATPKVPSRSFGSRFPRQGTLGLFYPEGHPVICIDTHFDFDVPAQMGASRVIKQHLVAYSEEIPVILMGDFNATPDSPCYRWLTGDPDGREKGLGFRETFTEPYPSTFHRFTGEPVAGYIDWILFRGPLRMKECRVGQASVDGMFLSDHFPVIAVFGF